MADNHTNFGYSTVLTAPSPAASGTSLIVQAGDGAKFPTVPFNATVWPINEQPTTTNAEIVRVTNKATDTFTISRSQESSSARAIEIGDQIAATITAKTFTDIETDVAAKQPLDSDLTTIAGLTATTDNFMVATASAWASRTPTQSRSQMGLGTISTQAANNVSISGGAITGITDLAIADGGTGASTATNAFDALAPTTTQGDTIYHNGTDNVRLAKGTAAQVLTMNAGATAPEWAAAGSGGNGYVIPAYGRTSNPQDAVTRYFGGLGTDDSGFLWNSGDGLTHPIPVPKAGTIKAIYGMSEYYGTVPSNEQSSIYLRLNSTTDVTITSTFVITAANNSFNATGLSTAVVAGDYFNIKWVTPTWATNPDTGVSFTIMIYIE